MSRPRLLADQEQDDLLGPAGAPEGNGGAPLGDDLIRGARRGGLLAQSLGVDHARTHREHLRHSEHQLLRLPARWRY